MPDNPRSTIFLSCVCLSLGLVAYLLVGLRDERHTKILHDKKILAEKLLLTDPCLSTESRHTRHYSQNEWAAAFQDVPGWHEHFPSSSFFTAPKLKEENEYQNP